MAVIIQRLRLEAFRAEGEHYRGLSFDTISGYAGHGAIIHYRVNEESDVPLQTNGIYLSDSGAHYLDGDHACCASIPVKLFLPGTQNDGALERKL